MFNLPSLTEHPPSLDQVRLAESGVADTNAIEAIDRVAAASRAWLAADGDAIRERAQGVAGVGHPPPLARLAPHPKPEVAMNRVLGWLLDPRSPHGDGASLLRAFAIWVGLPELAHDVDHSPHHIEVWVEAPSPRDWRGRRAPDLLVRGPSSALMVENKRGAPQGRHQFRDYAAEFARWRRERPSRAILLAQRSAALWERYAADLDAWSGHKDHLDLAAWAATMADESSIRAWTRVALLVLRADLVPAPSLGQLHALLDRTSGRQLSAIEAVELDRLTRTASITAPWRTA